MRINATSSPDANGTIGSEASNAPAGSDGLFGSLLRQALPTVFYMTHDEIVLLLACAVPLWYGVFAALQTLTGNTSADASSVRDVPSDPHSHRFHLALTNIARQQKATSNEMLRRLDHSKESLLGRLEALEQSHGTRYTEMHRDLACVYWEVARLRADVARLQSNGAAASGNAAMIGSVADLL